MLGLAIFLVIVVGLIVIAVWLGSGTDETKGKAPDGTQYGGPHGG